MMSWLNKSPTPFVTTEILASATVSAALSLKIDLIIVMTQSGELPQLIAKYKPNQFIFACCTSASVVRQLNLVRGVIGYKIPSFDGVEQLLKMIIKAARSMNLWIKGHTVLTLRALKSNKQDNSSLMEILEIE